MKEIIEKNYQSIVDRGLITPTTTIQDFVDKIKEEVHELEIENEFGTYKDMKVELCDIILTCLNFAKHFNIEIEYELKKKIRINEQRAINNRK